MGARGSGEGSVYQRRGKWVADLSLGYEGDKRKRATRTADTRREAVRLLTAMRHERDRGLPVPTERQTVGEYLEEWLAGREQNVRANTFGSDRTAIRRHIVQALGKIRLTALTPVDVQRFVGQLEAKAFKPNTIRGILRTLRVALNRAVKWDAIARNPAALAETPRRVDQPRRVLTEGEAKKLLAALQGQRYEALIAVALAVGLRRGEAIGLRWEDVDLDVGVLHVRQQLQGVGGDKALAPLKTASSRRSIHLPALCVDLLRRHQTRMRWEERTRRYEPDPRGLVFVTPHGRALGLNMPRAVLDRALTAAGLPHVRLHDLRHSCASLLMAQGVHPKIVAATLGHTGLAMTMHYTHVTSDVQKAAADAMGKMLG